MKKRYKISLIIGLVILFLVCGYLLRLDRFGFLSIHWADFIKYRNKLYTAVMDGDSKRLIVDASEIADKVGKVRYTLQGNVRSTLYVYRDFDASFLKKGTPIYRLKGVNNKNNLAIYLDGFYYLYRSESNTAEN